MNEKNKRNVTLPAYFVIDSSILKNENVNYFDVVVYSVICGLSNNEKNYCFATNDYLCNILNSSERSLQRSLLKLKENGLILIEMKNNSRIIRTTLNIVVEMHNKKLQEFYSRPKKELIDYDWLKGGL